MTKSTKSHQRERSPLFDISSRVHELVARSSAWRVRAAKDKVKIGSFATPHSFSHTTRANIAHEEAEQIRARIVCTPAESARRARVKSVRRRDKAISVIDTSSVSLRLPHSAPVSATPTAFASQIGQFPTGEGGSRRLANEAFINNLYQNKITFCCHHAVKAETAEKFQPLVYSSAEIDGRMRIGADSDE